MTITSGGVTYSSYSDYSAATSGSGAAAASSPAATGHFIPPSLGSLLPAGYTPTPYVPDSGMNYNPGATPFGTSQGALPGTGQPAAPAPGLPSQRDISPTGLASDAIRAVRDYFSGITSRAEAVGVVGGTAYDRPATPAAPAQCPRGAKYVPSTVDLLVGCDAGYQRPLFGDACECQAIVSAPLIPGIPNAYLIIGAFAAVLLRR